MSQVADDAPMVGADLLTVSPNFRMATGSGASTEDLELEHARLEMLADLPLFVKFCWHIANPGTRYVESPLIAQVCKQFAAYIHGTCAEVTVNRQPPGTTKSTIITQIGPVWGWLHYPHHRWGFASHSLTQSIKDSMVRRAIIADPCFQRVFRPASGPPHWDTVLTPDGWQQVTKRKARAWSIAKGQDAKVRIGNSVRGYMRSTSTGAKLTGDHFDRLVGDDLLDGKDRAKPEAATDWTFNVFMTRRRDGSLVWLNGQALHARDPGGTAVDRAREAGTLGQAGVGGVDFLCFPHHYAPDDPDRQCVTSTGATDWRTHPGQLLSPERFPEAWLKAKAQGMGPLDFAAQYEQNTQVDAVRIFPTEWWQRFEEDPGGGWLEVSVDSSNWSERKAADRTSITLARIVNGCLYRLRCWSGRFTLPEAVEIVARISLEYPTIRRWHVEDKAGGRGFMQAMKAGGEVGGQKWAISPNAVVAVNPQAMGGDLTFRADAAAPAVRAGRCCVMADKEGDAFIETCAKFPAVHPDDDVASWVQLATDAQISKHLGSRRAAAPLPRFSAPTAEVERRRAAVRGLPGRR